MPEDLTLVPRPDDLEHISSEFAFQEEAGGDDGEGDGDGEGDRCARYVRSVNIQSARLAHAERNLALVKQFLEGAKKRRDAAAQALAAAKTPAETKRLTRALNRCITSVERREGEVDVEEGSVADHRKRYQQAIDRLEECRWHHPVKHECGERGGPGIRHPGPHGRCYSWKELRHESGGEVPEG